MIDINADIISNKSIGNISLRDNVNDYLSDMYSNHTIRFFDYLLPDNEKRMAYVIDETITVATLADGLITSVGCNEKYKGYYMNSLHTGMRMSDIIKLTDNQRIFNGCIILNDDFGFSIDLPAPYDEIADDIDHIPLDLILKEMRVADYYLWKPKK
ncbi:MULTISPECIES: hypothetical protein [unclassified Brenneria]|uniref:hypothetical protein n=1 Tax=unclassified Brenneria TaxID=2634434 RepID=UPI0029C12CB4|nr:MULTISPECIES: hypothetical protein [unclassified Brenneria]MDX5631066.1 hypothetical protein [Brenneria sp. L3-3Z]MDX5698139.1 hypothetical protein [Brenneria sp. L4-2C]